MFWQILQKFTTNYNPRYPKGDVMVQEYVVERRQKLLLLHMKRLASQEHLAELAKEFVVSWVL